MKIVFDHVHGFGKVCHQDFIYSHPVGHLEEKESPVKALEEGWIPWDGVWYNLRSVRIDLATYKPHKSTRRLSHKIECRMQEFNYTEEFQQIYEDYCNYHNYQRDITWGQINSQKMIVYYVDQQPVGFSAVEKYDSALVAFQFVWNYKDPKLSLGKVAQMFECEAAKTLGCTHVYILGGYEKKCLYKSDFYGFEWWTGKEWSKDKELYQQLCIRDEEIVLQGYDSI
jgi:hypothetical protein